MANPTGEPIWYELMTRDLGVTAPFYAAVVGWSFVDAGMDDPPSYSFIKYGEGEHDGAGGAMQLSPKMVAGGAHPMWAAYFCVQDVDDTAARLMSAGGSVLMPPSDIEGVGRMAFVTDPQGNPFYLMRGFHDADSHVFAAEGGTYGRCGWNELITPDLEAALDFYRSLFGYDTDERMSMGAMGDYVFLKAGAKAIGAAMTAMEGSSRGWRFYFRVPDMRAARSAIETHGGTIVFGPEEVPGDEVIVLAQDPEGTIFGLLAPKKD